MTPKWPVVDVRFVRDGDAWRLPDGGLRIVAMGRSAVAVALGYVERVESALQTQLHEVQAMLVALVR